MAMSGLLEADLRQASEELAALYEGTTDGILAAEAGSQRLVRANQTICELLGYSKAELLSLTVSDIHPAESLPEVQEAFESACMGRQRLARNLPCRRKDGSVVRVDVSMSCLSGRTPMVLIGFFRDITDQNRTVAQLRDSERRYRLVADNVSDIIWTTPIVLSEAERAMAKTDVVAVVDAVLNRFRLSFVSRAIENVLGYTPEETPSILLREIIPPASWSRMRQAMIAHFVETSPEGDGHRQTYVLEVELVARDGSIHWCEIVSAYLRSDMGIPTSILGITRDITWRRKAEQALRESESKLRSLFENLPDLVVLLDRGGIVRFANRGMPHVQREVLLGQCGFDMIVAEQQEACRNAVDQAFAMGTAYSVETQDVFGGWWSCRVAPLAQGGDVDHVMVICTDISQERMATEAVNKEQQLLRQVLELHERERRLMAYEIHDGFAQQLAGAMFRLQGFREMHILNPEKSWEDLEVATTLLGRAIVETRRLISGLRPPILDESGVIDAIEYLVCERERQDGPRIEFTHNVAFHRLAPPLESALFRITQESLQNAFRHSRSEKVRIELTQIDGRIRLDVRDWGVGFSPEYVEEQRFGLQGMRERVRLLDGSVTIDSAPGKGTHIAVELPLVEATGGSNGHG
jgi:PAS domain S-box-containing protein